jgi:hypothetical protein
MSEQRTTTVHSDSFALWGELNVGPAGPPEKSEAQREQERAANRVRYKELRREFGWTDEDFERAKRYGFPDAVGRSVATWPWGVGESIFNRDRIEQWRADLEAVAASLPPRK